MANDTDGTLNLTSGYDLPVYGLSNGSFFYIHVPAILCIYCSLFCALAVIMLSFRHRNYKQFFSWTKSERFIIYLAVCDGGFNLFHSVDHLQYIVAKDHVRPKELCEFYGFSLTEFITAQNLMVNIVAINAFTMMFFNRNLDFGKYDYKLLLWTFGMPFVGATAAGVCGQFGPNGIFCHFDAIRGGIAYIAFTTIPLLLIFFTNIILYVLTWIRIKEQTSHLEETLNTGRVKNKSQNAARNMSMFVVAFFIQWWAVAVFSVWQLIEPIIPQAMIHVTTIFTNLGGCLNLGIYIIIRRKNLRERNITRHEALSQDSSKSTSKQVHSDLFIQAESNLAV